MRKPLHRIHFFPVVIISLFIVVLAPSCRNIKNLQYLQGSFDSTKLSKVEIPEPIVQKGDLLGITVYSDDAQATAAVTNPLANNASSVLGNTSSTGSEAPTSGASTMHGFVVSQSGQIQLFKLGSINAAGKTKKELADSIALMYANLGLLKNPFVEIRFLNYKVTIIGEVQRPGSFSIPTDKLSVFEAIGLAGDITVYGRRDNLLVIREINGVRHFGHLNLSDPNVFTSPYYYLQQNDMLIVDVGKNKAYINNQATVQTITLGASLLSIGAILISIFRR